MYILSLTSTQQHHQDQQTDHYGCHYKFDFRYDVHVGFGSLLPKRKQLDQSVFVGERGSCLWVRYYNIV